MFHDASQNKQHNNLRATYRATRTHTLGVFVRIVSKETSAASVGN